MQTNLWILHAAQEKETKALIQQAPTFAGTCYPPWKFKEMSHQNELSAYNNISTLEAKTGT